MLEILNSIDGFIWGPPLMILLIGTGILMSVRLGLLQVMKLPKALQLIFTARSKGEGDVSSFQALCTALAATVGTGNIVGVATAIKLGGPGALLWMWLAAFFGMATKYSEGVLAVKYRTYDENGNASGGPASHAGQSMGSGSRAHHRSGNLDGRPWHRRRSASWRAAIPDRNGRAAGGGGPATGGARTRLTPSAAQYAANLRQHGSDGTGGGL